MALAVLFLTLNSMVASTNAVDSPMKETLRALCMQYKYDGADVLSFLNALLLTTC